MSDTYTALSRDIYGAITRSWAHQPEKSTKTYHATRFRDDLFSVSMRLRGGRYNLQHYDNRFCFLDNFRSGGRFYPVPLAAIERLIEFSPPALTLVVRRHDDEMNVLAYDIIPGAFP